MQLSESNERLSAPDQGDITRIQEHALVASHREKPLNTQYVWLNQLRTDPNLKKSWLIRYRRCERS